MIATRPMGMRILRLVLAAAVVALFGTSTAEAGEPPESVTRKLPLSPQVQAFGQGDAQEEFFLLGGRAGASALLDLNPALVRRLVLSVE